MRVTLQQEKQTAVLTGITDTGLGIPADCRDSIFQPFFRVDKSRSREMGGVGLGLALVRRDGPLLHGGSVTVSSSENGTTFPSPCRWHSGAEARRLGLSFCVGGESILVSGNFIKGDIAMQATIHNEFLTLTVDTTVQRLSA